MTGARRGSHLPIIVGWLIVVALAGACTIPSQPEATSAVGSLATATPQTGPTTCQPTRPDAVGPFYEPDAPERSSVGEGHVLTGVVRSSADCSPIAGAQIEFWLAGSNGQYDDAHRATLFADASGAYQFESNGPPPYSGRPPHIHIRVSAEGYQTLVTQYYPDEGQTKGTFDLVLIPEG